MEQKLVRVPFEVELAKEITNGTKEGRIVTRNGRSARVLCFDRKGTQFPIVALIEMESGIEDYFSFCINGDYEIIDNNSKDLMLEIPKYMTFKDGDIIACGWEGQNESSSWISIVKSVNVLTDGVRTSDYITLIVKSNGHLGGLLKYDNFTNSGEWIRRATKEEKQQLIDALKASKEPKAKEYLKRFFGIEEKPECEFKPFDKVLVRDGSRGKWKANLFSHKIEDKTFPYMCVSEAYEFCLPYNEQTAHLLGTTDDWEG